MSNVFTSNPLILDTTWTALSPPVVGFSSINGTFRKVVWVDPTQGDHVEIQDINGNTIVKRYASTTGLDVVVWDSGSSGELLLLKQGGWALVSIPSGKLYLYR